MLHQLIAWDADGNVVATLDHMVAKDEDGNVVGLIDFSRQEEQNGRLRDIWEVDKAVGSGTWPEWLGARAHDFRVELDPAPRNQRARITGLIHKQSGRRRDRAVIEAAIAERIAEAKSRGEKAADLRDLLGGPQRPLLLDEAGRTRPRVKSARPQLPYVPARKGPTRPSDALDRSPEQGADEEGQRREQDTKPQRELPNRDEDG